jgi:hypothetical protein
MIATLRIEHIAPDFSAWKSTFDGDPLHRRESGVRRYRILRSADDPKFVAVDLDFDSPDDAKALLVTLQALWRRLEGTVIEAPRARILETVEIHAY